jgi:hypothetical protein
MRTEYMERRIEISGTDALGGDYESSVTSLECGYLVTEVTWRLLPEKNKSPCRERQGL